jgi:hypothetical protein
VLWAQKSKGKATPERSVNTGKQLKNVENQKIGKTVSSSKIGT